MWRRNQPNLGLFLLGVWLVVLGLQQAIDLRFMGLGFITGALAIATGALLILGR